MRIGNHTQAFESHFGHRQTYERTNYSNVAVNVYIEIAILITLSDLLKYSMTRSIARCLCDELLVLHLCKL